MTWTKSQRNVVIAAYLGWTLDAFDFFLMVFMFKDISVELHSTAQRVSTAVFLTLAMRPVGALLFGRLADRFGRKPALMWNIVAYSLLEMASGFAPTMTSLLMLRALFGVAMGGEWGVGSALTMESIPPAARGAVSGLLQVGYPSGYLLASLAVYLLYDRLGWRYMFVIGVLPAALVFFIRRAIDESPAWREQQSAPRASVLAVLRREWKLAVYAIVLMTAFNFFSHGSQDAYPSYFLKEQHHFDTRLASVVTAIGNVGAICGGLFFGTLSQRIGRRRAIIVAALIALPVLPFWAFGSTPMILAAGAFLMQVSVQGAWGVIPAHLNELSPAEIRATFPGVVYQLGNLLAAINLNLQVAIAQAHGKDFGLALAVVVGTVAIVITLMVAFGPERRGVSMSSLTAASRAEPAGEAAHDLVRRTVRRIRGRAHAAGARFARRRARIGRENRRGSRLRSRQFDGGARAALSSRAHQRNRQLRRHDCRRSQAPSGRGVRGRRDRRLDQGQSAKRIRRHSSQRGAALGTRACCTVAGAFLPARGRRFPRGANARQPRRARAAAHARDRGGRALEHQASGRRRTPGGAARRRLVLPIAAIGLHTRRCVAHDLLPPSRE